MGTGGLGITTAFCFPSVDGSEQKISTAALGQEDPILALLEYVVSRELLEAWDMPVCGGLGL